MSTNVKSVESFPTFNIDPQALDLDCFRELWDYRELLYFLTWPRKSPLQTDCTWRCLAIIQPLS